MPQENPHDSQNELQRKWQELQTDLDKLLPLCDSLSSSVGAVFRSINDAIIELDSYIKSQPSPPVELISISNKLRQVVGQPVLQEKRDKEQHQN